MEKDNPNVRKCRSILSPAGRTAGTTRRRGRERERETGKVRCLTAAVKGGGGAAGGLSLTAPMVWTPAPVYNPPPNLCLAQARCICGQCHATAAAATISRCPWVWGIQELPVTSRRATPPLASTALRKSAGAVSRTIGMPKVTAGQQGSAGQAVARARGKNSDWFEAMARAAEETSLWRIRSEPTRPSHNFWQGFHRSPIPEYQGEEKMRCICMLSRSSRSLLQLSTSRVLLLVSVVQRAPTHTPPPTQE